MDNLETINEGLLAVQVSEEEASAVADMVADAFAFDDPMAYYAAALNVAFAKHGAVNDDLIKALVVAAREKHGYLRGTTQDIS